MKTGKSLLELATEIERQQGAKRDFAADTREVRMETGGMVPEIALAGESFPASRIAHRQIGERVGIPAKYYNRMLSEAPALLAANVNHWFDNKHERRMIRTLDGEVRAFLSDRYQRIDNADVAGMVLPVLAEIEDLKIASAEITGSRMYIKAVTSRVTDEVRVGDEVQAGVMITNSEVGLGAITVAPLVMRLVCLNGMVLPDNTYRKHHVGARANQEEAIYEMLSDETRAADDRAILLKVRDVVKASLDEAVFKRTVERLRQAAGERIEGDPAKAVELLSNKFSFSQGETGGVLRYLIEGGDLSQYGMIQAVTRLAQDPDDYDRATELEAAGGRILDLPAAQWREIKMAA